MSEPAFWAISESEWLTSTNAKRLATYIFYAFQKSSPRKRTLMFCGCVRRIWDLLTDERCRAGIEVAERHADGLVQDDDVDAAYYSCADGAIVMDKFSMEKFAKGISLLTPLICAMPDAGAAA